MALTLAELQNGSEYIGKFFFAITPIGNSSTEQKAFLVTYEGENNFIWHPAHSTGSNDDTPVTVAQFNENGINNTEFYKMDLTLDILRLIQSYGAGQFALPGWPQWQPR